MRSCEIVSELILGFLVTFSVLSADFGLMFAAITESGTLMMMASSEVSSLALVSATGATFFDERLASVTRVVLLVSLVSSMVDETVVDSTTTADLIAVLVVMAGLAAVTTTGLSVMEPSRMAELLVMAGFDAAVRPGTVVE